jgi:hypothetical protein
MRRKDVTDQEIQTSITDVEAEINAIWDEELVRLMDACRASKDKLKENYGNNRDINRAVESQYLATITSIRDLARRRRDRK